MQPKMGNMDIDYQVLHDAFFKFQTKPKLTALGDLYFEGKEFEVKPREMKPGTLSHEMKAALCMPQGAPPRWLINMQRYGPPPSYPHVKIPGLVPYDARVLLFGSCSRTVNVSETGILGDSSETSIETIIKNKKLRYVDVFQTV